MRFKLLVISTLTVSLFVPLFPAFSQVVPAAYKGGRLPLSIGIGPSSYDVDWGHGRMYGGTIWADWYPAQLPQILHGLGIEVEARDISLHQNCSSPGFCPQKNMRQDTAGGGPIFTWRHYRDFHPYAKFMIEDGSVDFYPLPGYSHDTRTLFAFGGGFEYRIFHQIWARADYEYQNWGTLLGNTLNPQGVTVGVAYDFSHSHLR
jgi:opacity protein-like surface antigen